MPPETRAAFDDEMKRAAALLRSGELDAAFAHLERAHILGQRWLRPHLRSHAWMLRVGWRRADAREIAGQVLRLLASFPGAAIGWVPVGNPGGANVSALRPMPVPEDLRPLLPGQPGPRSVLLRAAALIAGALALARI